MADQFTQGPAIECLLVRLECHQVVRRQILEDRPGSGRGQRARSLADQDEIEKLLLER